MIPLYILGFLLRFGPQHGYQIKKRIAEQLEDFTQIKLPAVYYHLEKMEAAGLIAARQDQQGARPEKTVYSVQPAGTEEFQRLLKKTLSIRYRPTFDVDAAFYFSDSLNNTELVDNLRLHTQHMKQVLNIIGQHREETLRYLPEESKGSADMIFLHHILHYQAELSWAEQAVQKMEEAENHGKN